VLRELVEEHRLETGSVLATQMLAQWDRELANFWQVVPKEMIGRLAQPLSDAMAAAGE
jgi:glutamate synthase domain-containing protein 3